MTSLFNTALLLLNLFILYLTFKKMGTISGDNQSLRDILREFAKDPLLWAKKNRK